MRFVFSDDMHIAVQTCPWIPTRHLGKVVKAHCQSVVISFYVRSDIQEESVVAVVPFTRFLSVYKNFGVTHRPVELYKHLLIGRKFRHIELSAVPAYAYKRQASCAPCVFNSRFLSVLLDSGALDIVFHIKRTIDSPIVRYGHTLPFSIVVVSLRERRFVLTGEFPPFLEDLFLSPAIYSRQRHQ